MAQQDIKPKINWPLLGAGIGLRNVHYPVILKDWPKMDWFEAITENYMDSGGRPVYVLEEVRKRYPVALHGVSLSIGSVDSLDEKYLTRLKSLCDRIEPAIVSDHLCWSGVDGEMLHDLLPLPFTEEAIRHVVGRVGNVQEVIGRKILLENVSSYVTYKHSEMTEWEFISEVAKRSGCGILLDLNNVYVNSVNHHFDPYIYIKSIPKDLVGQFHLAGHTNMGNYLFDTHSTPIIDSVWDLYREALKIFGDISTLIEWDEAIPPYEKLSEEATRARAIQRQVCDPSLRAKRSNLGSEIVRQKTGEIRPDGFRQWRTSTSSEMSRNGKISLAETQHVLKSQIHLNSSNVSKIEFLNPQGGEAGTKRLEVYAAGYSARTHDGLYEAYETIRSVIGSDEFYRLSQAYTEQYPSTDYNLSFIGKHLPDFLKTYPILKQYPFLSRLAELEWFAVQSFHSFDEKPFNPKELELLPLDDWERAQFSFQPSVHLLESEWKIVHLWKERKNENLKIDQVKPEKEYLLVSRRGFQVQIASLEKLQFELLKNLIAGHQLNDALEALSEQSEALPVNVWFNSWVSLGLIINCQISRLQVNS